MARRYEARVVMCGCVCIEGPFPSSEEARSVARKMAVDLVGEEGLLHGVGDIDYGVHEVDGDGNDSSSQTSGS